MTAAPVGDDAELMSRAKLCDVRFTEQMFLEGETFLSWWKHTETVSSEREVLLALLDSLKTAEGRPVRVQGAGAENVAVRFPDKGEAAAGDAARCLNLRSDDPTPSPIVGDGAEYDINAETITQSDARIESQAARIAELERERDELRAELDAMQRDSLRKAAINVALLSKLAAERERRE